MFSARELHSRVQACIEGRISRDEFEDWFSVESWNVHKWGSADLVDAVFAIEAAFSSRHFDRVAENQFRAELANAIRPFGEAAPRKPPVSVRICAYPSNIAVVKEYSVSLGGAAVPSKAESTEADSSSERLLYG